MESVNILFGDYKLEHNIGVYMRGQRKLYHYSVDIVAFVKTVY